MSFEVRYTNSDPPHQPHGEKPRGVMTRSGGGLRCARRPPCARPGLVRTATRRTTATRITTRSGSGIGARPAAAPRPPLVEASPQDDEGDQDDGDCQQAEQDLDDLDG